MDKVFIQDTAMHPNPSWEKVVGKYGKLVSMNKDFDENVKLVVFTGGADVNPTLYGQEIGRLTRYNDVRDQIDLARYYIAKEMGIPMLGICRGAQFLCVMNGGSLVQHCSGHLNSNHVVYLDNGVSFLTNGDHHQMMIPDGSTHRVLAYANGLSLVYRGAGSKKYDKSIFYKNITGQCKEPEAVLWPEQKALGIQWHPEWSHDPKARAIMQVQDWVEEYLL